MFLVFDIGATNMRLAVSEDGKNLDETKIIPTPQNPAEGMRLFEETLRQLTDESISACAGGITKALNWNLEMLKDELQKMINAPVTLENDAAIGGLGEAKFGAGKDKKIVAFLTISTGVGGVRVVDGKIDANSLGFEPGHQIIDRGQNLEQLISGRGIEKRYQKKPEDLKEPDLWQQVARNLSFGLNNITVMWSPDIIVLGGSVMQSVDIDEVNENLKQVLTVFPNPPIVVKSALGDESGLLGALSLI